MISKEDFVIFKIDGIDRDGLKSLIIDIDKNFTYQPTLMVTEIGDLGVFELRDQRNAITSSGGIICREGLLIIDMDTMDTTEIAVNEFVEEISLILVDNRIDYHLGFYPQKAELEKFIRKCPDKTIAEYKKTIN